MIREFEKKEIPRRLFLGYGVFASGLLGNLSGLTAASTPSFPDGVSGKVISFRDEVLERIGPETKSLLESLEAKVKLNIEFQRLDDKSFVVAQYMFNPPSRPVVYIKDGWREDDVAHELMHLKIELVEGYSVLAWRKNVLREESVGSAYSLIRSYTDDMLVFARLWEMGFKVDGEIIKSPFFDDICFNVTKYLKEGRGRKDDGMAHLDNIADGRYGQLRRSTFLILGEHVKSVWYEKLTDNHKQVLDEFILTFRKYRPIESAKADKVLSLFKKYDIKSTKEHSVILEKWAQLEKVDKWVGITKYKRCENGYILPYPQDIADSDK